MNPIYATVAFDCGDNQKAFMYIKEDLTRIKQTAGLAPERKIGLLESRRKSSAMTTGFDRPTLGQDLKSSLDSAVIPNLAAIKAKQKATWESGDFPREDVQRLQGAPAATARRHPLTDGLGRHYDRAHPIAARLQFCAPHAPHRYDALPLSARGNCGVFRRYYGPTQRAFASLDATAQAALWRDLVALQTANNTAGMHDHTEVAAEHLEVIAVRSL